MLETCCVCRGGSRTAATSKMELFVIIVNGWKPLTIITKSSILDVAAVLDSPMRVACLILTLLFISTGAVLKLKLEGTVSNKKNTRCIN